MAFEWEPAERAAFDTQLLAHVAATFPDATFAWTEYGRRLLITFPDGAVCSIWEPNFFFSYPSFELAYLFKQAADHIAAAHQDMIDKGILESEASQ